MKFKIVLIMLLGVIFSMSAHILQEGFETAYVDSLTGETIVPGGWQILDGDGDSYNWFCYDVNNTAHNGLQSLASESWKGEGGIGALTPDNWVITPAITIPDSTNLYWWIATQDVLYPNEHYGVFLSDSGGDIADFTTLLYSETLDTLNVVWQQRAVNLQEWAGQTVYLAWRHYNCTDNYRVKIDDILVTNENVDSDESDLVVSSGIIDRIYPNPFNPETNINFYINEPGQVNLSVYNIKGQLVENLVSGNMDRGEQNIIWKADDQPSGMYLFRLKTSDGESTGKAMLLK